MLDSSKRTSSSIGGSVSKRLMSTKQLGLKRCMIRSEVETSNIHIYDGRTDGKALHTISKMHASPVHLIKVRLLKVCLIARLTTIS
jgi:hypothetical protein